MTTTPSQTAAPQAPKPARNLLKPALILSLLVNLALGGLVLGALLREPAPKPGPARDLGLGAVGQAMSRDDWKAMRPAFLALHPEFKRGAGVLRSDFDSVLKALRADPFAPQALQEALSGLSARNAARLSSAAEVIAAYLAGLPAKDRAAYADRLENILTRDRERAHDQGEGRDKDRD